MEREKEKESKVPNKLNKNHVVFLIVMLDNVEILQFLEIIFALVTANKIR